MSLSFHVSVQGFKGWSAKALGGLCRRVPNPDPAETRGAERPQFCVDNESGVFRGELSAAGPEAARGQFGWKCCESRGFSGQVSFYLMVFLTLFPRRARGDPP